MRAIRVATLALIGTAALALGAPAALADDGSNITSFGFTVSPTTVAPGETVTLSATECESVTASSGVFDSVTLTEGQPGTATVDEGAKPGAAYDVTFDCKGEKGTAPLSITAGPASLTGTGTGTDTDTGAGTPTDTGTPTGTATDPGTGTLTGTGTGVGPDPGTAPAPDTGPDTGTGLETVTGSDPRTGKEPDTGSDVGPVLTKPDGGVKGGAGGSFADLGPTQISAGSALIAGAFCAGGFLLLRRRAGDGV